MIKNLLSSILIKFFTRKIITKLIKKKDDVYSSFKENLTFGNNHYKTKLPFKNYNEILPDNFYLSKIRLNNVKTRLDKSSVCTTEAQPKRQKRKT